MKRKEKRRKKRATVFPVPVYKDRAMIRVYLSGGMGGRVVQDVVRERELSRDLCKKYKMLAVDPGELERDFWKNLRIPDNMSLSIMRQFIENDKKQIRRCDVLLVLTGDKPSDGTWREMCYSESIGIPVVMVAKNRYEGKLVSWSNVLVTRIEPSIEKAISYINRTYNKRRNGKR